MKAVTETSNELTNEIDLQRDGGSILRILRQCDAQIFSGWRQYPCIYDTQHIQTMTKLVEIIHDFLASNAEKKDSCIILSGSGTSGRIAVCVCQTFNKILLNNSLPPIFYPLIAGGSNAIVAAQEKAEDEFDPTREPDTPFVSIVSKHTNILLIGITCGFSAAYVAGQLQYLLDLKSPKKRCVSVLLGFNLIESAKSHTISNWDRSFSDVLENMLLRKAETPGSCFILNPIVGPEAITGSTRMKSGSATKILLEVLFSVAMQKDKSSDVTRALRIYDAITTETYCQLDKWTEVVQAAANTISKDGHIIYLSDDVGLAELGLVDASECPPTYGARFSDVRGFVPGGWDAILQDTFLKQGKLLKVVDDRYCVSLKYFETNMLKSLTSADLIINLCSSATTRAIADRIAEVQCKVFHVYFLKNSDDVPEQLLQCKENVVMRFTRTNLDDNAAPTVRDFAVKLVLNSVTTAAFVMTGKIYENLMIDLKVSNHKLFIRAIGIVQKIMNVEKFEDARMHLLHAIYGDLDTAKAKESLPIDDHVLQAFQQDKIVPTALLLASQKFKDLEHIKSVLKSEPIVRKLLLDLNK